MALRKQSFLYTYPPNVRRLQKVLRWAPKKIPPVFQLPDKHSLLMFSWSNCARAGLSIRLLALPMVIKPEVKWLKWGSQFGKGGG